MQSVNRILTKEQREESMKKASMIGVGLVLAIVFLGVTTTTTEVEASGNRMLEITFQNMMPEAILTPPIFATDRHGCNVSFFEVGEFASSELEELAEGGNTTPLAVLFMNNGANIVQHNEPLLPGETITIEIPGNQSSELSIASMLLPTNDGFTGANAMSVRELLRDGGTALLRAYDAGTEGNSELFADIPGPFGGVGYIPGGGEGFVHSHPNLIGGGDADPATYRWGEFVAKISVRVVR